MTAADQPDAGTVAVQIGAICQLDGQLLLVRRGHGSAAGEWTVPTVAMLPGETAAEAVVRAGEQLTGREVLCGPFIGWSESPSTSPATVTLYFEGVATDRASTAATTPSAAAVAEARLIDIWQVSELRLGDGLAEFLADQGIIDLVV